MSPPMNEIVPVSMAEMVAVGVAAQEITMKDSGRKAEMAMGSAGPGEESKADMNEPTNNRTSMLTPELVSNRDQLQMALGQE